MPILFLIPPIPDWTFKPSIDFRERFERRIDKDFNGAHNDNRNDLYERWRAGGNFQVTKDLSARALYQFAYDAYWSKAKNGGAEFSDLYEGWGNLKIGKGNLKAGRQEFVKGDKRLFDQGDWGNNGRTWDMVRYTDQHWDAWAGRLGLNSSPSKNAKLVGIAYKGPNTETMLFFKHDDKAGLQDNIYVLDQRWTRKSHALNAEVEMVGEVGEAGGKPLRAWAGEARVSYQTAPKLSLYAEADVASGGHHGNTQFTFDQMYPGNHSKYGVMDMQGWRNMKGLTLGTTLQATKTETITFEYNHFGLFAANDNWYSDNGKPNKGSNFTFIDPTGASGTDVGQEFDLSSCLKLNSQTTIDGGLGMFIPGHFIDSFGNAGDRNQFWGYVQCRIKF